MLISSERSFWSRHGWEGVDAVPTAFSFTHNRAMQDGHVASSRTWPDPSYVATNDEIVEAITNNNVDWAEGRTEITYSLSDLGGFSYREATAIRVFNAWNDIINVTFRAAAPNETPDITFDVTNRFFATPPNTVTGSPAVIEIPLLLEGSFVPVSNTMLSLMHEIAHVLGFRHPASYDSTPTHDETFANDTRQFTILSYFTQDNYQGSTTLPPMTLQIADIISAISRYGSSSARTGNDVYGFNTTPGIAGGHYDFSYYDDTIINPFGYKPGFTIFDTGGIDTLDVSGFVANQRIDIRDETWSDIGGNINNIAIARGTYIENAIGGSGDDTITGNALDNTLSGGNGDDTVLGGNGNDTLYGGGGHDYLAGGNGHDNLYGQAGNDHLLGGIGNDTLLGGIGDDLLRGGAGSDVLWGHQGNDRFRFDTAPDGVINIDLIQDFVSGEDRIELDDAIFSAAGSPGSLAGSAFAMNTTGQAIDADDRIIFNTTNGYLTYDADGSGTIYSAIHFATLAGVPDISATDVYMI